MDSYDTPAPDPLLVPFLKATDRARAQRCLDRLLQRHANPTIERVVWRKCGISPRERRGLGTWERVDAEDAREACAEARAQLVAHLCRCRERPDDTRGIPHFNAYVVVVAHRAWFRTLRRKNPRREALRAQIRYLLAHTPGLALWEDTAQPRALLLGGLAEWQSERRRPNPARWRLCCTAVAPHTETSNLRPTLFLLFHDAQGPAEVSALVTNIDTDQTAQAVA